MGVPKFFRWISARYPCINQVVRPNEIPEIDHLYLDMNGILHNCSHPEGLKVSFTEDEIFKNIQGYIEFIFQLIKPCKTFFMAVDGVAPRAKMTQQRARRFQSAQEARDELTNALRLGRSVNQDRFDPCVISPGTKFMERLHTFLKNFVDDRKVHDEEWRVIDVILSGHDCPGEGEHKIREFIFYKRNQPTYISNERHCIYGMDADLIFLGLVTHEVNLCILRENVIKARTCLAEETPFCITFVTLVREYIDCEFKSLKSSLPFSYNLERIIDDWIFLAFLLGNDFIPHLPNLHIHAESLLVLWDTYHVVLPNLDGYLVEFGQLHIARFDRYLEELSKFEQQWFEDREADHRWMRGKRGQQLARDLENLGQGKTDNASDHLGKSTEPVDESNCPLGSPVAGDLDELAICTGLFAPDPDMLLQPGFLDEYDDLLEEGVVSHLPEIFAPSQVSNLTTTLSSGNIVVADDGNNSNDNNSVGGEKDSDGVESDSDLADEDQLTYRMHRRDYYHTKLCVEIDQHDIFPSQPSDCEDVIFPIARDYVRMLQWILTYYFYKVTDWQFFYPYHYAPFACDLRIFTRAHMSLDASHSSSKNCEWANFNHDSQPVLPFVQQLMILPADSAYLVPEPYRYLMTSPDSPLASYFPQSFSTDINGKIASWEAVVLIPFIDETILLEAMEPLNKLVPKSEKKRNQHMYHLFYPACISHQIHMEKIKHNFFRMHLSDPAINLASFYDDLLHTVTRDFPSLFRLKFTTKTVMIPVHVFEQPSRGESLCLQVASFSDQHQTGNDLQDWARRILGKPTYTRWPYLATVMPVRLMAADHIWELKDFNISPSELDKLTDRDLALHHRIVNTGDSSAAESRWFSRRIQELYRHYRVRRAIVLESDDESTVESMQVMAQPVLIFSRQLDGWFVKRRMKEGKSTFTLAPLFARSRPGSGDELKLVEPPLAWTRCFTRSPNMWKRNRSAQPSIQMEPSYSLCDGLALDLLAVTVPEAPQPPLIRRCRAAASRKALGMDAFFCVGQSVISFNPNHYGRAGEVAQLVPNVAIILVRFYPYPSYWIDTSCVQEKSKLSAPSEYYLDTATLANLLGLPSIVVARMTGTLFIRLKGSTACSQIDNTSSGATAPTPTNVLHHNKPEEFSVGLNLRIRSKCMFISWSRYCPIRNTWLFSDLTKQLLVEYVHLFPEFWRQLSFIKYNLSRPGNYPIVLDVERSQMLKIMDFLKSSNHSKSSNLPNDGEYIYGTALEELRLLVSSTRTNSNGGQASSPVFSNPKVRRKWYKTTPLVRCTPESLLLLVGKNRIYPSKYFVNSKPDDPGESSVYSVASEAVSAPFYCFHLWDRVFCTSKGWGLPFGLGGTVIGIPSPVENGPLEIMFDQEFAGAIDIRGSGPRCARLQRSSLICIPRCYAIRHQDQHHPLGGSQQQNTNGHPAVTHKQKESESVSQKPSKLPPCWQSKPWPNATTTGGNDLTSTEKPIFIAPAVKKVHDSEAEIKELNSLLSLCKTDEECHAVDDLNRDCSVYRTESLSLTSVNESPPPPPSSWCASAPLNSTENNRGIPNKNAKLPVSQAPAQQNTCTGRRNIRNRKLPTVAHLTCTQRPPPPERQSSQPHEKYSRPHASPLQYSSHNTRFCTRNFLSEQQHGGTAFAPQPPGSGYNFYPQMANNYMANVRPDWNSMQRPYGAMPPAFYSSAVPPNYTPGYPSPTPYYGGVTNFQQYSYPGLPPYPQNPGAFGGHNWVQQAPHGQQTIRDYPPPQVWSMGMPMGSQPGSNYPPPHGFTSPQVARKRCA